jgi:hypothetical protein
MRIRSVLVPVLMCSLLWNSSAIAQQHVVDPAVMRQALASQAATDQQNRDTVLGVLAQDQVRALAERLGLSVMRAEAAVSTLSSTELAGLAESARAADVPLVGGADPLVISVTTLLLIIIIVILIAR